MTDTDEDGIPDSYEIILGTNKEEKDTDKDGLTDFDEIYKTGTNPLKFDSVEEGKSDSDVDIDEDGLSNAKEIEIGTNPINSDTDNDDLSDKDEIEQYKTNPLVADTDNDKLNDGDDVSLGFDPLNPDTNGNSILDGDEKIEQTFTKDTSETDEVVSGIEIKLNATGNVNKTTKVTDIKDKDMMCTDVVGLVGNPYEITTESQFDNATITFKVDKEKLGDTQFEDLMFLWYDEENDEFVELDTILDEENSTVTVETTHFSKYMLVDSKEWFDNWRKISTEQSTIIGPLSQAPLYTAICVDCSGSMSGSDPKNLRSDAVKQYTKAMLPNDWASIIRYSDSAELIWTKEPYDDKVFSDRFYNGGGTNAEAAVKLAVETLKTNTDGNDQTPEGQRIKTILLLADGDVNVTNATLNEAKELGIIINSVSLGVENNTRLMQCAETTGGEYFEISEAYDLKTLYNKLYSKMKLSEFKKLPDDDNDSLPNVIEQTGIPLSNGKICFTDYQDPDTDNDNLEDGEEVTLKLEEKVNSKKQINKNKKKNDNSNEQSDESKDNKSDEPETILVIDFDTISDPTRENIRIDVEDTDFLLRDNFAPCIHVDSEQRTSTKESDRAESISRTLFDVHSKGDVYKKTIMDYLVHFSEETKESNDKYEEALFVNDCIEALANFVNTAAEIVGRGSDEYQKLKKLEKEIKVLKKYKDKETVRKVIDAKKDEIAKLTKGLKIEKVVNISKVIGDITFAIDVSEITYETWSSCSEFNSCVNQLSKMLQVLEIIENSNKVDDDLKSVYNDLIEKIEKGGYSNYDKFCETGYQDVKKLARFGAGKALGELHPALLLPVVAADVLGMATGLDKLDGHNIKEYALGESSQALSSYLKDKLEETTYKNKKCYNCYGDVGLLRDVYNNLIMLRIEGEKCELAGMNSLTGFVKLFMSKEAKKEYEEDEERAKEIITKRLERLEKMNLL